MKIGDYICDMHGHNLRHPPEKLTEKWEVVWSTEQWNQPQNMLFRALNMIHPRRNYLNKYLMVIAVDEYITAAYVYDNHAAGIALLRPRDA